jgi:hypothetical protein
VALLTAETALRSSFLLLKYPDTPNPETCNQKSHFRMNIINRNSNITSPGEPQQFSYQSDTHKQKDPPAIAKRRFGEKPKTRIRTNITSRQNASAIRIYDPYMSISKVTYVSPRVGVSLPKCAQKYPIAEAQNLKTGALAGTSKSPLDNEHLCTARTSTKQENAKLTSRS